jgi:hypothetical protein
MCDRLSPEKLRELLAVARAVEAEHQRRSTGLPPDDYRLSDALSGRPQAGSQAEPMRKLWDRRTPGAQRHPDLERRSGQDRRER